MIKNNPYKNQDSGVIYTKCSGGETPHELWLEVGPRNIVDVGIVCCGQNIYIDGISTIIKLANELLLIADAMEGE